MYALRVPSLSAGLSRSAAAPRAHRRQVKVTASGYTREQQEFLERKARESRSASAAPAPTRGRSASPRPAPPRPASPRPASPRPSFRPSSSPRPDSPSSSSYSSSSSYNAPAPAASGLSAEQQAFLARKASEPRPTSPAPTRGRSASPRSSFRPSSSPRPASPTPSASYSAPAPAVPTPAAAGLSAEQQAFLARKATESRPASAAPAPVRGRSASPRPASPRPSSRPSSSPRPASASYSSSSSSSSSYSAPAASYSAPAPAAPAPSVSGLSPEQQAFLARKAAEPRPASPVPTRGRSASPRPASPRPSSSARPVSPAPVASYSAPTPSIPEPRSPSPAPSVEDARAALERTLERSAVTHPRDVPAPAAQPQVVPSGPSTGRWPDPVFVAETLAAFPEKGVANAEETRALLDGGWTILDVRSELEQNAKGKLRNTVIVPCVFEKPVFDASRGEMVTTEQDNPSFLERVQKAFPNKQARIIVACSNGSKHSIDVLEALEEEGYTNLVGLKGGYNAYVRVFDFRHNPKDKRPVPRARAAMKKLL